MGLVARTKTGWVAVPEPLAVTDDIEKARVWRNHDDLVRELEGVMVTVWHEDEAKAATGD